MLQLVYVSSVNPVTGGVDPAPILVLSRRNNARDDVTGVLYSDGSRFLQVLEGPEDAIDRAFARIKRDKRHCRIALLSRREIKAREFGDEALVHRTPGAEANAFIARVTKLVARAPEEVRATFEGFPEARRAA